MRKIILFIVGLFMICLLPVHASKAQGLVKGSFSENIEGVDHEKIIDFGKPGFISGDEMLVDLGLNINPEDKVTYFPDPALGIGSKIEILRAATVSVWDAGEITTYRTWKTSIGDLLAEKNIPLGNDDQIDHSKDETIKDNMEIVITRVAITEITESESIDYDTVYENDPTMERGTTAVGQAGELGRKDLTYQVKRENGKEVEKNLLKVETVKEPVSKIILKGTKVTVLGKGKATWYDWISGNTAASNVLPHGTKVLVRNNANGAEIEVTIVDHGIQGDAIIDLSEDAFAAIGDLGDGVMWVTLEKP